MSYSTISAIQHSPSLMDRATAGLAAEVSAGLEGDASQSGAWVSRRSWDLAATPGWADAWESAEAGGISDPGANEGVITDGMILARLQQLLVDYPLTDLTPAPPA